LSRTLVIAITVIVTANVTSTCNLSLYPTYHYINLSNLSLSWIINQILSHGSYTKDTSQLDVQHHQHMPLPSMYQYHQHTITRYVSQVCTKPSTYTIPSINHVPQPTKPSASTMHQHLYQTVHPPQQCTSTPISYHVP
jgi:hypothetical protein